MADEGVAEDTYNFALIGFVVPHDMTRAYLLFDFIIFRVSLV